jgi:capsular polysaccharide export protein
MTADRYPSLVQQPLSLCLGFTLWKRHLVRSFLRELGSRAVFVKDVEEALALAQGKPAQLIVWASEEKPDLSDRCAQARIPLLRMEDGFVRSVGLGSDFSWPFSFVLDQGGIYFDPQSHSDLEGLLNESCPSELKARAAKLRQALITSAVTKYAVGRHAFALPEMPQDRKRILVPGQVAVDASVLRGGGAIQTNLALLEAVREANPDAFILYKPHPDVMRGNRPGAVAQADLSRLADAEVQGLSIAALFDQVDEVHTLTSLAGFEALMRGLKVHTYGGPFYAGWGLTEDRLDFPRRQKRLTLDEMVATVLLRYPAYYDWHQGELCSAETALERLESAHLPWTMRLRSRVFYSVREFIKVTGLVSWVRRLKR